MLKRWFLDDLAVKHDYFPVRYVEVPVPVKSVGSWSIILIADHIPTWNGHLQTSLLRSPAKVSAPALWHRATHRAAPDGASGRRAAAASARPGGSTGDMAGSGWQWPAGCQCLGRFQRFLQGLGGHMRPWEVLQDSAVCRKWDKMVASSRTQSISPSWAMSPIFVIRHVCCVFF